MLTYDMACVGKRSEFCLFANVLVETAGFGLVWNANAVELWVDGGPEHGKSRALYDTTIEYTPPGSSRWAARDPNTRAGT